eukprot:TRINITY_DN12064_c0_g1_i1.p1 TRINITY_DN12064_c0_g1~~TRINITY_DN12064_c0_g1_i1.p1  ORF type:complete len:301 (-),score=24.88 TRINITY_DN12064_c0_g1_i1:117-1019(-)
MEVVFTEPTCFEANVPAFYNVMISLVVDLGNAVCYLPQIYKLFETSSSKGLNILSVFLYNIGNSATLFNAINDNWDYFFCCKVINFWECSQLLMAFYQLFIVWINWHVIFILCIVFWPREFDTREEEESSLRERKFAIAALVFYLIIWMCGGTSMVIAWNFMFQKTSYIYKVTDITLGTISSIVIAMVWIPQIWTTYKMKGPGALSIGMLALTAPGCYITIYTLAFAYEYGVTVWLPTVVGAICQTTLLIMCIYYSYGTKLKNLIMSKVFGKKKISPAPPERFADVDNVQYIEESRPLIN